MDPLKRNLIIAGVVLTTIIFSYGFIAISNKLFPRQEAPTIREGSIIAENWIRNFSSFYVNGKDLRLVNQEELKIGNYRFLFTFLTDDTHYGIHENEMMVETLNNEVVKAITNGIFDEMEKNYLEEDSSINLYFTALREGTTVVVPVERTASVSTIENIQRVTLEELLRGPTAEENEQGYYTEIEPGTSILSFRLEDGVLYLELSFDFSKSETATNQITMTMTQFEGIDQVKEPERKTVVKLNIDGVPDNFIFEEDLKEGSEKIDVKYLQIILNADPDTKIADTGIGSPGEENETFDSLTSAAVKKFQRKYSEEILAPAGLIMSTGVVDKYTRDKLNSILEENRW